MNTKIKLALFLGGFSGLIYETAWQKMLANIYGSDAKSAAVTLALFLGGMGLGYFLFKEMPGRFLSPVDFCMATLGFLTSVFISPALLFPVCILMGASIPALTKHYPDHHPAIYSLNLFGAVAGCLVSGFVLLPFLGISQSIWVAATLNIICAGLYWSI